MTMETKALTLHPAYPWGKRPERTRSAERPAQIPEMLEQVSDRSRSPVAENCHWRAPEDPPVIQMSFS